jgi:hypothetical protein
MIVNGAHGKMMDVNCLANRLLKVQDKTGKERLAKFNTLRSMEVLNVLVTLQCMTVHVKALEISHLVVLAVPKVLGVTGVVALLPVVMVARRSELAL